MPAITITIPPAMAQRVSVAYGRKLRLGRDASAAEIKDHLVERIRETVRVSELEVAQASLVTASETAPPVDIT